MVRTFLDISVQRNILPRITKMLEITLGMFFVSIKRLLITYWTILILNSKGGMD